jgi:hypothetical protein
MLLGEVLERILSPSGRAWQEGEMEQSVTTDRHRLFRALITPRFPAAEVIELVVQAIIFLDDGSGPSQTVVLLREAGQKDQVVVGTRR